MLQVVQFLSDQIQVEEIVFSGDSGPPSSIACTSTGRPATTVEWYRCNVLSYVVYCTHA